MTESYTPTTDDGLRDQYDGLIATNKTKTSQELFAEIAILEKQCEDLRKQALDVRQNELLCKKLSERLVYAAYSHCPCGAGLAYDPAGERYWDCSAIILGTAD